MIGNQHGYKRYNGLVGKAIRMLKKGERLPADLMVALMNIGVDLGELEEKYAA